MNKFSKIILAATLALPVLGQAQSLEDRVSELEAQQSLNTISVSGSLTSKYDSVLTKTSTAKDQMDVLRMKFMLNVNSNISDKLKFYSTLSTSKYFNWFSATTPSDTDTQYYSDTLKGDFADANRYETSHVFLEKAYFDYFMTKSLALSVGRLPTVHGPYTEYYLGLARQGTYPLHLYNVSLDGMALSYNLALTESQMLSFRYIYTPLYVRGATNDRAKSAKLLNNKDVDGNKINPINSVGTVMLEYGHSDPGFAGRIGAMVSRMEASPVGYNYDITTALSGPEITVKSKITVDTINLEFYDIADVGLDVYAVSVSTLQNFRQIGSDAAVAIANSGNTGASDLLLAGLGQKEFKDNRRGSGSLYGVRYRFLNKYHIGYETISNSKFTLITDAASGSLTGLYDTNGTADHTYIAAKLEPNLVLRIGATTQKPKFDEFGGGRAPKEVTGTTITNTYADLRLDF